MGNWVVWGLELCRDINGLSQDCSNSSALALELLQSCDKPSILRFRYIPSLVQDSIAETLVQVSTVGHSVIDI